MIYSYKYVIYSYIFDVYKYMIYSYICMNISYSYKNLHIRTSTSNHRYVHLRTYTVTSICALHINTYIILVCMHPCVHLDTMYTHVGWIVYKFFSIQIF